ncbi:carbohydrate sulfotransferase 11 isoform X5 [Hydra vulgaris]|uniref:Carbohydrate sulfotransferase n=1 Tax=Hydra vulgaris TaxID=6087 RepID=A0ABM4C3G9_HYDVU
MRVVTVRALSLIACGILLSYEFWKAVYLKKTIVFHEEQVEGRESENFDEYSLVDEYLLTSNIQDIENSATQRKRKRTVTQDCHKRKIKEIFPLSADSSSGINSYAFRNILLVIKVSDKHQLLYCVTPKVACTNWKRVLLVLDGYFNKPDEINSSLAHNFSTGYFRKLSDYSPEEISLRLTTYYKFLFVRHPYERLVSTFRNKFVETKYKTFKLIYGKYIMRKYRELKNITNDIRYIEGEGLKFEEFIKFIIDSPLEDADFWNEHWERIDRLCLPCLVQYDFVGKFESLKQDADYLLRTLDVADKVTFPEKPDVHSNENSNKLMKQFFKSISKDITDKLYELFKHDFLMFNYKKPQFGMN